MSTLGISVSSTITQTDSGNGKVVGVEVSSVVVDSGTTGVGGG